MDAGIKKKQVTAIRKLAANYQNPDLRRSIWQIVNTVIPYFLLWSAMIWSLRGSYMITLLFALPAAGMVVRIFIIFHDCGHGSFFKSSKANHWVGTILGILVFTPYFHWRQAHATHHATAGNLDKRGVGDVWTMTVDEYMKASSWKRLTYRVYRNPFIMFGIGPLVVFLITHRFASKSSKKRERNSVILANFALVIIIAFMSLAIGLKNFVLIQLPVIWIATMVGVWMFYVQHQFEGVYWERAKDWDYVRAGLEGSSFYQLPKVLQWFTGNIGFHHIHHLSPKIPNYLLESCHKENSIFQVKPVRLLNSMKSLTLRLWDEQNRKLVSFRILKSNQFGTRI